MRNIPNRAIHGVVNHFCQSLLSVVSSSGLKSPTKKVMHALDGQMSVLIETTSNENQCAVIC